MDEILQPLLSSESTREGERTAQGDSSESTREGKRTAQGESSEEGERFFKVLAAMRRANKRHFDPLFFTFGPYHATFPSPCEHFKLQAANALTSNKSFDSLMAEIEKRDSDIRDLYGEPWDHSQNLLQPNVLANLLALDALTVVAATVPNEELKIFQPHAVRTLVRRDAFLLDHQLPLFVLQSAINNSVKVSDVSLKSVVKIYAYHHYPLDKQDASRFWNECWKDRSTSNQSMIGCIYDMLTCNQSMGTGSSSRCEKKLVKKPSSAVSSSVNIPTASQLRRCGISFDVRRDQSGFKAIRFDERTRVLSLPKIAMYNETPSYLLNLAAYEVAYRHSSPCACPVSSYIKMMDWLLDAEEDVKLLVDAGVIENQLGSHKELASIWNKMATYLPLTITSEDEDTNKKVSDACKIQWRKWIAGFLDDYWDKRPWLLISLVAAIFLFVMTSLQTIYTMLQYYKD